MMKRLLILIAGIISSFASVLGQPELSIKSTAQNKFEISWSAVATEYKLEQANALGSPLSWFSVLNPQLQNGDRFIVPIVPTLSAQFFRLHAQDLLEIQSASPYDGEIDVAVTRETIIRFSVALEQQTLLDSDHLYATAAGRKILSCVEIAGDRKQVTMFYLEPLPGSAQVNVFLNPKNVLGGNGQPLDPSTVDPDGKVLSFQTLSLTPLVNTAVIGTVYDSEIDPKTKLNKPLAGVTITVDGMEQSLRTVTDLNGKFTLNPVPPGRFFVHIDGRTVVNASLGIHYPD